MPLFDYRCENNHRQERLVPAGLETTACVECGAPAVKVYGYKIVQISPDVDTRGMFRRYVEASEEMEYRDYNGPSLWKASKNLVRESNRVGENPMVKEY